MKQSLKANYLQQFPEQHRQFVHNRFSQAYIFSAQSYEFNEDDEIDIAVGPRTMKTRVVAACQELLPWVNAERKQILNTVIATIETSDELLGLVKTEVDADWEEARKYQRAHPKDRKEEPATQPQLDWLKKLGCDKVPQSKREASQLIDKYKKKHGTTNSSRTINTRRRPGNIGKGKNTTVATR